MNKHKKADLLKVIIEKLEPFYKLYNFKFQEKRVYFYKDEWLCFWGPASEHIDSLTFRPWFRLTNKKIKTILQLLFPDEIGGEITIVRHQSPEMLIELGIVGYQSNYIEKYESGCLYAYHIDEETLLDPIINDHINYMKNVALPFFEKLETISGIDSFLNDRILLGDETFFQEKERQNLLKKYFEKREVLSGIVSAYLVSNPHLEELIHRYHLLWEGNRFILDDFEKVLNYFRENPVPYA
ncbi:MAG: hypothetical protein M9911_05310 [Saprospiraceae bacterium]|jgi:hypothetical protein|nr:hypothetical protein [Saprospiraceae bacterium]